MTVSRRQGKSRPVDVAEILGRLADLGPPSEIRNQSPALAAAALGLDRVLLTGVRNGVLGAEALHVAVGSSGKLLTTLRETPVALQYPLVEGEIMRRCRARVVRSTSDDSPGRHAFAEILGWTEYAAAPVMLDGRVIGFFHGDRHSSGGSVEESDANGLASFATCFAIVFERAVLRHRLRVQRREMREVASWAEARAGELGDRSITLDEEGDTRQADNTIRTTGAGENALRDLLTPRELEVLRLIVRGETNVGIARELVLAVGTVKFHVKNILRKLHAANRADATSRYLRLTLKPGSQGWGP